MVAQGVCNALAGVRFSYGPPSFRFSSIATNAAPSYGAYREFESHLNHHNRSVAQLENVPSYEVERWGFESLQTDQICLVSSVVEQRLDKALVVSSILTQGTNFIP